MVNWTAFSREFARHPLSHVSGHYEAQVVARFAKLITFVACNLKLTPNTLTVSAFLLALSGTLLFVLGPDGTTARIVALGILQLGYFTDWADGQLARMQGKTSRFGAFLDLFLDRAATFVVFIGFGVMVAREQAGPFQLRRTLVYAICAALYVFYTLAVSMVVEVFSGYGGAMQRFGTTWKQALLKTPYHFVSLGVHYLLLSVGVILGMAYYVALFYGAFSATLLTALVGYLYYRECLASRCTEVAKNV